MLTTNNICRANSKSISSLSLAGEEIILSCTASYDVGVAFSCWRPGVLYLTNKKLFFVQVKKVLFQIFLNDIQKIEIEKRSWLLGKKINQLHICWQTDRARYIFIVVRDSRDWKRAIEIIKNQKLAVDIFEEGNKIVIMVEFQTGVEDEIDVKVEEKKITIIFKDANGTIQTEEIFLPSEVLSVPLSKKFYNQVLEIELVKKDKFSYEERRCKDELWL